MSNFLDLQNGWYNGLIQGLGQSQDSFQIIQPAPPIASGTAANPTFWAYYNNIAPKTLTSQFAASGGNQFYNNYRGLLSALVPSRNIDVRADIGAANFDAWQAYVQKQPTLPTMNQIPTMFRNWAMFYAPNVANIGSSDYAAILLDPIATAQNELTLIYTTPTGLPLAFDWQLGYLDLVNQLANSPSRSFSFDSSTMNSNVSSSWAGSSTSGFFGLWGGSSSTSTLSEQFASSRIQVSASFDHILVYSNTPGAWYYSSAMGLAYANQTGNPWSSQSSINWNNTFGKNGNMQYFSANIIAASGMSITITSDAKYSSVDQQTITSSGSAGFWPFYSGDSGSSSSNRVTFSESGQMTITTNSIPGVPIVLGVNVLSAGEFVGHSSSVGVSLYESARSFVADNNYATV
ncbi:hypothetical protein LZD49_21065 [Dyadobacter sp. CY261]|uniref:hypothetical protein n=1 Tax=Dyadobacter sp. CY261 TaxID=2907203 RepID=UPI001F2E8A3E|nr:hypothetical protein [Dyadobacter sp. CY261]MCF0072984.1 hypothetical protein [Dyadobacter sp. CY261]